MAKSDDFGDGVLTCVDDINAALPALTEIYDPQLLLDVFIEHGLKGLKSLVGRGVCGKGQAEAILGHIEENTPAGK